MSARHKVRVYVSLKNGVLDPQGRAIHHAIEGLGFSGVSDVRAGRLIELEVDDSVTDAALDEMAQKLLANMVIAMFKETALLSSITIMELLAVGKSIGSINFRYIEPLTIAGVLYFLVSYACARFVRTLESPHVHAR